MGGIVLVELMSGLELELKLGLELVLSVSVFLH